MSSFQEKSVAYFKEADVDGSGFLTMLEVYKVLKKNGCNASADEVCVSINSKAHIQSENDEWGKQCDTSTTEMYKINGSPSLKACTTCLR